MEKNTCHYPVLTKDNTRDNTSDPKYAPSCAQLPRKQAQEQMEVEWLEPGEIARISWMRKGLWSQSGHTGAAVCCGLGRTLRVWESEGKREPAPPCVMSLSASDPLINMVAKCCTWLLLLRTKPARSIRRTRQHIGFGAAACPSRHEERRRQPMPGTTMATRPCIQPSCAATLSAHPPCWGAHEGLQGQCRQCRQHSPALPLHVAHQYQYWRADYPRCRRATVAAVAMAGRQKARN